MSYQFELETDFEPRPHFDSKGSASIDFALGYDPERGTVVVMSVLLVTGESYKDGKIPGLYDLQFGIRVRNFEDGSDSNIDFSSTTAQLYIPEASRGEVTNVLLDAVSALVDAVKPRNLTMETFHGHLPPKALKKYAVISDRLKRAGYELKDSFQADDNGINYWHFEAGY